MKKRIISKESFQIPFKAKFAHNSASREATETIVVEIKNEEGVVGYGESCPRSYVTGETIVSAKNFIDQVKSLVETIFVLSELEYLQNKLAHEIDKNPSAWCALEMAILDLIAKEQNISVEKLLKTESNQALLPYSAVVGVDSFIRSFFKCIVYKSLGFYDFKLKLSGNQSKDLNTLKLISCFAKKIRVDANNLFESKDVAINYLLPLCTFIWAIEEPLKDKNIFEMKMISEALDIKIILDESFLNGSSLEKILGMHEVFIPNVRISKLGGVLRTLDLVKELEKNKFHWILGSHVGEMSLLTRASLLISSQKSNSLLAIEGGFSTHLLTYDPFFPNLKLGKGAIIKKNLFFDKAGWGMDLIKNK